MQDVAQGDCGLVRNGLQDQDFGLRVDVVRVAVSEQPKADETVTNFQRENEAHPFVVRRKNWDVYPRPRGQVIDIIPMRQLTWGDIFTEQGFQAFVG